MASAKLTFDTTNQLYPLEERSYNTKFESFERANGPTAMRRRQFFVRYGPGPTSKRKAQIDASAPLQAAPEPPNCRGGLEQRRTQQLATIPSTPDPARRRRKQALVSRRLAHWQRGWGVAKGRFALWAVCAVASGG